ncbi:tyrosine-type recombinase/integrase [Pseudomonas sp. NY15437]|uniref:site-specific integrase n=1 Tax=Pseudomonas sp. NY15437 TaxID=3400360 RepID=UPI003A8765E3
MTERQKGVEIDSVIQGWVTHSTKSRESLLKVPLAKKGREPVLSWAAITEQTGLSESSISKRIHLFAPVLREMRSHGIIVDGHSSAACDFRRRLLSWFEGLSPEERAKIPVAANTIKFRGYLDGIEELSGLRGAKGKYALVRSTFDEILDSLRESGVLDRGYRTVKQRNESKEVVSRDKSLKEKFSDLRGQQVKLVSELGSTTIEPYFNLLHLYSLSSLKSSSDSGQDNFICAYKAMRDCLVSSGLTGLEDIREMITPYSLPRFRSYLEERIIEGVYSSSHCSSMMSATRAVMKRVVQIEGFGITHFMAAEGFDSNRETDNYKPYPKAVRENISLAINQEIDRTNELAREYVPSGLGQDPLDESGRIRRGFRVLDSARWIFENKLGFKPIGYRTADKDNPYHRAFLAILNHLGASIEQVYQSWGVLYQVDSRVLAPYMARLAQITGLNADSLVGLELDDFVQSHDLTGRPCLRYWKERSDGEKLYHLDLFHADISWLTTSQGLAVKKLFDDVKLLTKDIRKLAPESIRGKLFIYQSSSPRKFGVIDSVQDSDRLINQMFSEFSADHNLQDENGNKLRLSASRFRPSFVSELVERGVSIREIQVLLGHANITTTLAYLDKMDFNFFARNVLNKALHAMHQSTLDDASVHMSEKKSEPPIGRTAINTGLVSCRDVFDPPDFIKNLKGYDPKKPCTLLNKCLSCSNSIITVSHLPELFAMRREYQHLIEVSRVLDTPYGEVVLSNLEILNSILDPETSDFSLEELTQAERLSENIHTQVLVERVLL